MLISLLVLIDPSLDHNRWMRVFFFVSAGMLDKISERSSTRDGVNQEGSTRQRSARPFKMAWISRTRAQASERSSWTVGPELGMAEPVPVAVFVVLLLPVAAVAVDVAVAAAAVVPDAVPAVVVVVARAAVGMIAVTVMTWPSGPAMGVSSFSL